MNSVAPALILGGYGSVGSRSARMLRRLQPGLAIAIAGRNLSKAEAIASEIGNATAVSIDIDKADLGLDADEPYSVVVTALRDLSLNTMRFAQTHGIPYVALSDGVFELGPTIARFVHDPTRAPILLLGHSMGGVPALAALHCAEDFASIDTIELSMVFDPADPLGPTSAVDMDRIAKIGPSPLVLDDTRWRWIGGEKALRSFRGIDGAPRAGQAVGLQDVLSLASAPARSIRIDFAEGVTATSKCGDAPSHEVVIEIAGLRKDGARGRFRYELIDPEGYAAMSARGIAIMVEQLLGLAGGSAPGPGLYLPEVIVAPSHFVACLRLFGLDVVATGETT
jgi:hypothetical protein